MKVIILGVLLLLPAIGFIYTFTLVSPFLLCLGFFPLGYIYRILRTFMEGSDELPNFDDWKSLASDGFKVALVIIVYLIPPLLVSLIFIFQQGSYNLFTSGFTIWILLSGSLVGLIILVLMGVFGLIGIANMALYNGEIRAAFRFNEILERISLISWKNYLIWYLLILVVGLITVTISSLTLMILIGILLVPIVIIPFYAIFITRSLCLIFASSEQN